ncbi:MAG: ATP-binding protein, partial [Anaerolineae bacterium]|nr:ATP-binding protein [Anaerolineae bacterium]
THGVAMRGFDFGGQTKIAYTQDRNLHALEVTDLDHKGRMSTERFFNGTKSGYPRRMRCIQGSDAHRINAVTDKSGKHTNHGVGDRVTELLLPERSFDALLAMFQGTDYSRSRPYTAAQRPYDYIQAAREEGETLVQSFHEQMTRHGGRMYAIIADVCAFANTNGGTVYVGLSGDKKKSPVGVEKPPESLEQLQAEIARMISPTLDVEIDIQETGGKPIIRIQIPSGEDRPYAIDDNKIYVRDEADTSLAVRDEIVSLVKQGLENRQDEFAGSPPAPGPLPDPIPATQPDTETADTEIAPPTAGVEIIGSEQRGDTRYYIMRDLRNGNIVKNVTRSSARHLWHYAIKQHDGNPVKNDKIEWRGEVGLWLRYERGGVTRYDLVQKADGKLRVYYGVTDSGMHSVWQSFLAPEDEE